MNIQLIKEIEQFRKNGFVRAKIDGEVIDLSEDIKLEKNKNHNIEVIVDRLVMRKDIKSRLTESIETALAHANKMVVIEVANMIEENIETLNELGARDANSQKLSDSKNMEVGSVKNAKQILFSCNYACPDCGFSFPEITPRMFSFNSPMGACPSCLGIGFLMKMDEDLIIPDKNKTLYDGVKAFGASTMKKSETMAKMYFEAIGKHYGVDINKPIKRLPRDFLDKILYGTGDDEIDFEFSSNYGIRKFTAPFEGVIPTLERRHSETKSEGMRNLIIFIHSM